MQVHISPLNGLVFYTHTFKLHAVDSLINPIHAATRKTAGARNKTRRSEDNAVLPELWDFVYYLC